MNPTYYSYLLCFFGRRHNGAKKNKWKTENVRERERFWVRSIVIQLLVFWRVLKRTSSCVFRISNQFRDLWNLQVSIITILTWPLRTQPLTYINKYVNAFTYTISSNSDCGNRKKWLWKRFNWTSNIFSTGYWVFCFKNSMQFNLKRAFVSKAAYSFPISVFSLCYKHNIE